MKKPRVHVTDHALLRYLERVLGMDLEFHRRQIGQMVDRANAAGASGVVIAGFSYRLQNGAVVTICPVSQPDIRLGRKTRPGRRP